MTKVKPSAPLTLAIDIGGTTIKMLIMDCNGKEITPYIKRATPHPATVSAVYQTIASMCKQLTFSFDRVSVGFPGVVHQGIIKSAFNMDISWINVNLEKKLHTLTNVAVRAANDADIQGYGDIIGKGVEMVITLGTGVGSALFLNGKLVPNLELGHHPFVENNTYEDLLNKAALDRYGQSQWCIQLNAAIAMWLEIFNCDRLYIGGGLSTYINFKLPTNVLKSDNIEGTLGGIKLWET